MSISSQISGPPTKQLKSVVEMGMITWNSTNTTGAIKTTLRRVKWAAFTSVVAATPVADVTQIVATPDSEGTFAVNGGTLSLGRTTGTTGLKQLYRLEGY